MAPGHSWYPSPSLWNRATQWSFSEPFRGVTLANRNTDPILSLFFQRVGDFPSGNKPPMSQHRRFFFFLGRIKHDPDNATFSVVRRSLRRGWGFSSIVCLLSKYMGVRAIEFTPVGAWCSSCGFQIISERYFQGVIESLTMEEEMISLRSCGQHGVFKLLRCWVTFLGSHLKSLLGKTHHHLGLVRQLFVTGLTMKTLFFIA